MEVAVVVAVAVVAVFDVVVVVVVFFSSVAKLHRNVVGRHQRKNSILEVFFFKKNSS